jgi:hypothetical protein
MARGKKVGVSSGLARCAKNLALLGDPMRFEQQA